jgi:NADPH:quinone reductase-like Zn-dependent oxidoreductase
LQGVDDHLRVKPGESVIVHGASGGVGNLAVQFAKLRGARVLATASGEDGIALALRLGADEAVDGKRDDIRAAARRFAPDGIDAVLATAGGDALEHCIDTLKPYGRVAYPHGVEPEPRPREGIEVLPYDAVPGVSEFERLRSMTKAARLQVPIAEEFPLTEARRAHERIARGHVLGKIVLRIS